MLHLFRLYLVRPPSPSRPWWASQPSKAVIGLVRGEMANGFCLLVPFPPPTSAARLLNRGSWWSKLCPPETASAAIVPERVDTHTPSQRDPRRVEREQTPQSRSHGDKAPCQTWKSLAQNAPPRLRSLSASRNTIENETLLTQSAVNLAGTRDALILVVQGGRAENVSASRSHAINVAKRTLFPSSLRVDARYSVVNASVRIERKNNRRCQ